MIYESFPEAFFPITPENNRDYCLRVEVGELNAKKSSVLICGLARNIETNFLYLTKRIEKIGSFFDNYSVFLYENDSSDNTKNLLKKWAKENKNVNIESETLKKIRHEQDHSLQRRIDMADYRNKYIEFLNGKNFDYVIVLDTDVIGGYSYEGILHSLSFGFDVTASNSVLCRYRPSNEGMVFEKLYYDSWAFRHFNHEEKHDDQEINLMNLQKGLMPFEVFSAFGGLCIYKDKILQEGKYFYNETDCDHVTLHKQMRQDGYKIFVNPSQIVLYSPSNYVIEKL